MLAGPAGPVKILALAEKDWSAPYVKTGTYYVAEVDMKTGHEVEFSRIECEDSIDAHISITMLEELYPKLTYIVGYVPSAEERASFVHICRGCNCQFDRRQRLVKDG